MIVEKSKAGPAKIFFPMREEPPLAELENYHPSVEEIKRSLERKKQDLRLRTEEEKLLAGNWSGQYSSALLPAPEVMLWDYDIILKSFVTDSTEYQRQEKV